MSTILDLAEVRPRLVRLSVEDYEHLTELSVFPQRSELIRGFVIEKMSKSPLHCSLAEQLGLLFQRALPEGFVVFQERPLRLADSEPEPDVSVVRGLRSDFRGKHPTSAELVVEVAITSVELDRANASLYAEAGIPEYWIVLGLEKRIEVYRHPVNGLYTELQTFSGDDAMECRSLSQIEFPLPHLFAA